MMWANTSLGPTKIAAAPHGRTEIAAAPRPIDRRFAFGRNWKRYLAEGIGDERVTGAMVGLQRTLGVDSLGGMSFLDVGSGSGIHSLAALRLGANRVISFDLDAESLECAHDLRVRYGIPAARWSVCAGSVLDRRFMDALPENDVVYAWGVLHHTGAMWDAVDAVAAKVRPAGWLCLGLYNRVNGQVRGTEGWARIKRWYCGAPVWQRRILEEAYVVTRIFGMLAARQNPRRVIRDYGQVTGGRGMSWRRDVTDWLGGYPFEGATAGDVLDHVRRRFAYVLERQWVGGGVSAVNEYVFRRPAPCLACGAGCGGTTRHPPLDRG